MPRSLQEILDHADERCARFATPSLTSAMLHRCGSSAMT